MELNYKMLDLLILEYNKNRNNRLKDYYNYLVATYVKFIDTTYTTTQKTKLKKEIITKTQEFEKEELVHIEKFEKEQIDQSIKVALYTTSFLIGKTVTKTMFKKSLENNKLKENLLNLNYFGLTQEERFTQYTQDLAFNIYKHISNACTNKDIPIKELKKTLEKDIDRFSKKQNALMEDKGVINVNKAEMQTFKDLEVEKVEFVATLDKRTSNICRELDGKVWDINSKDIKTPVLDTHSRCRSVLLPYTGEEVGDKRKDGISKKNINDTNYKEWLKNYE